MPRVTLDVRNRVSRRQLRSPYCLDDSIQGTMWRWSRARTCGCCMRTTRSSQCRTPLCSRRLAQPPTTRWASNHLCRIRVCVKCACVSSPAWLETEGCCNCCQSTDCLHDAQLPWCTAEAFSCLWTEPLGPRLHPHVPAAAGSERWWQRTPDIVGSGAGRVCEQQSLMMTAVSDT